MKVERSIIEKLKQFNFTSEQIELYLLILAGEYSSVSDITREVDFSRSKVESTLEVLQSKGIVGLSAAGKYVAYTEDALKEILDSKKEELRLVEKHLPQIVEELTHMISSARSDSKVLYYEGIEGLKQVMWNTSKVEGVLRLFELADMSSSLDFGFYEEVRKIYAEKKIESREITNQAEMQGWTDVKEYIDVWEARYIDPKLIKMKYELIIYNNVYVLYYANDLGISCVEIYNEKLAQFQKQLFDFMWKKAGRMEVIDEHGAVKLIED